MKAKSFPTEDSFPQVMLLPLFQHVHGLRYCTLYGDIRIQHNDHKIEEVIVVLLLLFLLEISFLKELW